MKNLAVIPARSGSKGLHDKNIKEMIGKPLMAYSIEAALTSGIFDIVIVSTDSESYAEIGKQYGAEVPFLRSAEMSSDKAGSWDMVREVLRNYRERGRSFDTVCLLQPTSPLRTAEDIRSAYKLFLDKGANAVVSICEADHSPLWMNQLPSNLLMDKFLTNGRGTVRQNLGTYYRINGAIYIVGVEFINKADDIYQNSFAYVMPRERSVDIDTLMDFKIAECLMDMKE